nr:GLPGLI family protein [uncultured Pedobacter sp.]
MKTLLTSLFLLLTISLFGQQNIKNKIIKITFLNQPYSQYQINSNSSVAEQKESMDLNKGYKFYYTLYISPSTNQSIYTLDTVMVNVPKNKADIKFINDKFAYCIRYSNSDYILQETVFERDFFAKGSINDIEWEITDEKKKLYGFNCTKAISKNKKFLITTWFTNEIPVSSGPVNYFGLPGFVVWSEDFFRTSQLEKIEYIENNTKGFSFDEEIKKYVQSFDKKKGANFIKEPIYLDMKSDLVESMLRAKQ